MGAWVPPWERKRDEPDREFQDAAEAEEQTAAAAERAPEAIDAPLEIPGDDVEPAELDVEPEVPLPEPIEEAPVAAPVEPGEAPAPIDEPAPIEQGTEAETTAYLSGYADTAVALGGNVAEVTPEKPPAPAVPVQAVRPRTKERAKERAAEPVVDDSDRTEKVFDDAELTAALEAILLVVDEPTGELQLAQVLEQPVERVARALDDISARYTAAGHGFDLRRAAGGWRLYTRPEYAEYVERFVLDGQSVRLTQAALETLAVVAYKQPVTRSRISAIRGVNCDGVMRTLVTRGLIEECGTEPETGAYLYRTTALFLEKLGLNSVDQLPPLAPFLPDDVEEVLDASG
ncbi:SMC-Scp complex subunit ScpB [Actinoplanes awajinensis]